MYIYECPRCRQQGLVRAETVIKAGRVVIELYCGRCDFAWKQPHEAPPPIRRPGE